MNLTPHESIPSGGSPSVSGTPKTERRSAMISFRRFWTGIACTIVLAALPGSASAGFFFGTYYEDWVSTSCQIPLNGGSCEFPFAAISGPKPVLMTRVSCTASADPDADIPVLRTFFLGTRSGGTLLPNRIVGLLPEELSTGPDGVIHYAVNDKIRLLFGNAQVPTLFVSMTEAADIEMRCTITGSTIID